MVWFSHVKHKFILSHWMHRRRHLSTVSTSIHSQSQVKSSSSTSSNFIKLFYFSILLCTNTFTHPIHTKNMKFIICCCCHATDCCCCLVYNKHHAAHPRKNRKRKSIKMSPSMWWCLSINLNVIYNTRTLVYSYLWILMCK